MTAQILALIIFLAMFVLIILEVWDRHLITLGCGLLTLVLVFGLGMRSMSAVWETLNVKSIFTTAFWYAAGESSEASSGINWQTIIFIAGMMIMVEGMARVGFFRWLCMRLAKLVKYQVIPIFMTFMVLSFVLAMFIDSITVFNFNNDFKTKTNFRLNSSRLTIGRGRCDMHFIVPDTQVTRVFNLFNVRHLGDCLCKLSGTFIYTAFN